METNGDGSLIATTGLDGRVLLSETGASEPLRELLPGNDFGSQELAFSRDGSRIAFTSKGEGSTAATRRRFGTSGRTPRCAALRYRPTPARRP